MSTSAVLSREPAAQPGNREGLRKSAQPLTFTLMRQGLGPIYGGATSAPNFRTWPIEAFGLKQNYTTDHYQRGDYANPHKDS